MKSRNASSGPTTKFSKIGEAGQTATLRPTRPVVKLAYAQPPSSAPHKRLVSIRDFNARSDDDPSRREHMNKARQAIAEYHAVDGGDTLRSLRLKRGLSQTQLAYAIGTKQPAIARMERGTETERTWLQTCRRLSAVLGVDLNTLDEALRRQESLAAPRSE
jgi:ribosome-binding protein aMBF1 (putative translation factor)